jgi:hypothetical protein
LFLTRLIVEPASDVSSAPFPQTDSVRRMGGMTSRPLRQTMGGDEMAPPMMMDATGFFGMDPSMGGGGGYGMEETAAAKMGFVLLIEGYSPYERIAELLDPHGVGDNERRWGFVTRIANLGKLFPDVPFELYEKGDITHFKLETGRVDLASDKMPAGIGVVKDVDRVPPELLQAADRTTRTQVKPCWSIR